MNHRIFSPSTSPSQRFRSRSLGAMLLVVTYLVITPATVFAQRLSSELLVGGTTVRTAFKPVVKDAANSTVVVFSGEKHAAFGTVVSEDGLILTKGSELTAPISVRFRDGRRYPAEWVGLNEEWDLGLLRVNAVHLKPVQWIEKDVASVGQWIVSSGVGDIPASVGVVSVAPRKLPPDRPILGIMLSEASDLDGAIVREVFPETGAAKAGLKPGDVIKKVFESAVKDRQALQKTLLRYRPGDTLELLVEREKNAIKVRATLGSSMSNPLSRGAIQNRMGGELSNRRTGFPRILQHDTVLRPNECGGPVLNLDGKVVGINIARGGRTESYAITSEDIRPLLAELRTGKHPPPPTRLREKTAPAAPALPEK